MNTTNATGEAAASRQAALLLHAMGTADKAWLLGRLAPQERASMEGLLLELGALGIPADAELLHPVLASATPAIAAEAGAAARLAQLDPAQVAALAHALLREPAPLVARLLAIRDWSWKQELLACWDEADRLRLTGQLARPPASRLLDGAVCDAVVRLIDSSPPSPVASTSPRWRSMWRALHRRPA